MVRELYTYKNMRCILFLLLIFIVLVLNSNLPWLDHVILCRLLIGGHGFLKKQASFKVVDTCNNFLFC